VQNAFLASVETIAELIGVSVSKRSLEQILVAAVDGKDIPVVKPTKLRPRGRRTSAYGPVWSRASPP
jgi:hypothetical protein